MTHLVHTHKHAALCHSYKHKTFLKRRSAPRSSIQTFPKQNRKKKKKGKKRKTINSGSAQGKKKKAKDAKIYKRDATNGREPHLHKDTHKKRRRSTDKIDANQCLKIHVALLPRRPFSCSFFIPHRTCHRRNTKQVRRSGVVGSIAMGEVEVNIHIYYWLLYLSTLMCIYAQWVSS